MKNQQKMKNAARNAMIHVLDLVDKDRVLVVTDGHTQTIGEAFYYAAEELGCGVDMYLLPEKDRPFSEVPSEMVDSLNKKDVIINAFKGVKDETPFRVKWIKQIMDTKSIRLGHCPNITEAMMTEGPMNVDFGEMVATAKKMIQSFENAKSVHITTPGGTDIVIGIEGRTFITDVKITPSNPGNLPCGEIFCAPEETKGEGILVIDGSIGDIGDVSQPLTITVQKGKITQLESKDQKLVDDIEKLISLDNEASVIGELGIGLNPGAKITGNMLEDEKASRTAHIAFGDNEGMPGGKNRSKTHRDFLFYRPTFLVSFKDGTSKRVIEEGEFQIS